MILLTVVGSGTHHFDELFNSQAPLVIAWLLLKSRHQIGEHTKRIHCLFIAWAPCFKANCSFSEASSRCAMQRLATTELKCC
jgi:hypothetical protein